MISKFTESPVANKSESKSKPVCSDVSRVKKRSKAGVTITGDRLIVHMCHNAHCERIGSDLWFVRSRCRGVIETCRRLMA